MEKDRLIEDEIEADLTSLMLLVRRIYQGAESGDHLDVRLGAIREILSRTRLALSKTASASLRPPKRLRSVSKNLVSNLDSGDAQVEFEEIFKIFEILGTKTELRNLKILRAFILERQTKQTLARDFNLNPYTIRIYRKRAIDLIWPYASENLRNFILQVLSSARSGV